MAGGPATFVPTASLALVSLPHDSLNWPAPHNVYRYSTQALIFSLSHLRMNSSPNLASHPQKGPEWLLHDSHCLSLPEQTCIRAVQGGLFVFDGKKQLVYAHQDQATADHAPMPEVMTACCS